jgi:hypothetical protein
MRQSAVMDLINELEERFNVDRWTVNDLHVWPYLRIKLSFDLFSACHAGHEPARGRLSVLADHATTVLKDTARFCYASLADHQKSLWPRRHADVVLVSDGSLFRLPNGTWFDRFCDPLAEHLADHGLTSFRIDRSRGYQIPRYTPSLLIGPYLDGIRTMGVFAPPSFQASDALAREYPAFCDFLNGRWPAIRQPGLDKVRKTIRTIGMMAQLHRTLLLCISPSIVFVVSYYDTEGMALNLACSQLGLPSVDIQHGLQGDLHVAYGRWNKVPDAGYALLPSVFWCWSEDEASAISKWSSRVAGRHRPIAGGNLWLSDCREGRGAQIAEYDRVVLARLSARPGAVNILVTMQPDPVDDRTLEALLTAIQAGPPHLRWWFRIHPCMLKQRGRIRDLLAHRGVGDSNLDLATDLPLYTLLRHMDLHLTHSSSTVIEAESFGVPSIIISEYGAEFFPSQIASGWARVAYAPGDILAAVERQLDAREGLRRTSSPAASSSEAALRMLVSPVRQGRPRRQSPPL